MTMCSVIGFHRYNIEAIRGNWFRAKYFLWFNETTDLLGDCATFEELIYIFNLLDNERKYIQENVDEIQLIVTITPLNMLAWE